MKVLSVTVTDEQFNFILSVMKHRQLKTPAKVVESLVSAVCEQAKEPLLMRTPKQRSLATLEEVQETLQKVQACGLGSLAMVKQG